jgi:hypothetical protein
MAPVRVVSIGNAGMLIVTRSGAAAVLFERSVSVSWPALSAATRI